MATFDLGSFGSDIRSVEAFYQRLQNPSPPPNTFDLSEVGFVKPIGIMALVLAARSITEQSGHPVRLINLDDDLLAYLERIDLFEVADKWLQLDQDLPEEKWDRNPQTANLLELTPIKGAVDVANVMARAEAVFSRWLQLRNLGSLLKVISELCSNIYQHSGDPNGFVLIQRYQSIYRGEADVILVAGDMGQGIRRSLAPVHPELGDEPLNFIEAAMNGTTSRHSGRGGLGLRTVEETVAEEGGYIWLRSETAAIRSLGPDHRYPNTDLTPVQGTQVVVELHSPLPY